MQGTRRLEECRYLEASGESYRESLADCMIEEAEQLLMALQRSSISPALLKLKSRHAQVIPHANVKGEVPLCRCNGYCKCGLADALGRAREEQGKWLAWL